MFEIVFLSMVLNAPVEAVSPPVNTPVVEVSMRQPVRKAAKVVGKAGRFVVRVAIAPVRIVARVLKRGIERRHERRQARRARRHRR